MKKESNIPEGGIPDKPDYPGTRPPAPKIPTKPKTVYDLSVLEMIFNEWNKRYSENPSGFTEQLDTNGNPISDYGESCAVYFQKLSNELAD